MGGLAAAVDLARRGADVTVLERAARPGGKMREVPAGDRMIDAGPTVFTMKWIFDGLFEDAGARIEDHLTLHKADLLARHAWRAGGTLDLFADIDASTDAICAFAGPKDAEGFRRFCARSRAIFRALAGPFIAAERPTVLKLMRRTSIDALWTLAKTPSWRSLWRALGDEFHDIRLRQLFGRYATYTGLSPFMAPATLMLIAHVELDGVWVVEGGMARAADALQKLGEDKGATYRFGAHVAEIHVENGRACGVSLSSGERLNADAIVFNGDVSALGQGLLGSEATQAAPETSRSYRSLSAVTWRVNARAAGFNLDHHNVFFAEDYAREFRTIFRDRGITDAPTVYLCAQDRGPGRSGPKGAERMLLLINAPADGDRRDFAALERELWRRSADVLGACGLSLSIEDDGGSTAPDGFHALFPGTGGALYGRAGHGAFGTFQRLGASSRLPGLYFAGGSVHPGAGVPMAAMSGRLAAARILDDLAGGSSKPIRLPAPAA